MIILKHDIDTELKLPDGEENVVGEKEKMLVTQHFPFYLQWVRKPSSSGIVWLRVKDGMITLIYRLQMLWIWTNFAVLYSHN